MARRRTSKCPEPLNIIIDLLGAIFFSIYTKHRIKEEYKKGSGDDAVKAAMLVYGHGALHGGGDGTICIGGLYGVQSALNDIEKEEKWNGKCYKTVWGKTAIEQKKPTHTPRKPAAYMENLNIHRPDTLSEYIKYNYKCGCGHEMNMEKMNSVLKCPVCGKQIFLTCAMLNAYINDCAVRCPKCRGKMRAEMGVTPYIQCEHGHFVKLADI